MFNVFNDDEEDSLLNELLAGMQQDADSNSQGSTGQVPSHSAVYVESPSANPVLTNPALQRSGRQVASTRRNAGDVTSGATRAKRQRDADKVKELEVLAAAKMEQFAALVQRNAELKYKSKILSEAVMLRDYQLTITKAAAGQGHVPPPVPLPAGKLAGSSSVGCSQLEAARTVAQALRAPGSMRLLLQPELLPPMIPDSVRGVSASLVMSRFKAFAAEASTLLLALEDDPDNETAAVRLRNVCAETGCLCRYASILAPETMLAVMQTHLESGLPAAPESGHWQRVLQTMQLEEEQLRDLRAVYGLFDTMMRGVLAERSTLQARLAESGGPGAAAPFMQLAMTIPPESEVLPHLERNMRKEASAHNLLRAFVFGHKLSVLQFCRGVVHSYPFFPNATGLVAAAAGLA